MAWLPPTSLTVEPARCDINCCAGGGIILSSVTTRYQLGLVFHAGVLTAPLRASNPQGTWEFAMNSAFSGGTSPANDSANFALSKHEKAVNRRQDRRHRRTGRRICDQRPDRFPRVWGESRNVNESVNVWMISGFGNNNSAI